MKPNIGNDSKSNLISLGIKAMFSLRIILASRKIVGRFFGC